MQVLLSFFCVFGRMHQTLDQKRSEPTLTIGELEGGSLVGCTQTGSHSAKGPVSAF